MTTTTVRTYYYPCPSCGKTGAISKSKTHFYESLELKHSDYPRCLNCKHVFCGNCAKQGLCTHCYNQIPPKLKETLDNNRLYSRVVPIFITLILFVVFLMALPNGFIIWIIGGFILGYILIGIGSSIGDSKSKSEIENYFRSHKFKNEPSSNHFNATKKVIGNLEDYMYSLNVSGFSKPNDSSKQQNIPHIKAVILDMSRMNKKNRINLSSIGVKSNASSLEVVRKILIEMIANKEIIAQFDYTKNYITFY